MAKSKQTVRNYAGWYGVGVILLAYALLSFRVFDSQSVVYQFLNLTGALGVMAEALGKKDVQPAVLNGTWALVALIALFRLAVY